MNDAHPAFHSGSPSLVAPSTRPLNGSNKDRSAQVDRRREQRASLDVLANRFLEGHPYLCCATDISRQGMRIRRLNEPEQSGGRFAGIQFQLPGCPDVLTASGQIVFEDRVARTLGIRFTHLSSTAAGAIDRYLEQRQQR